MFEGRLQIQTNFNTANIKSTFQIRPFPGKVQRSLSVSVQAKLHLLTALAQAQALTAAHFFAFMAFLTAALAWGFTTDFMTVLALGCTGT